MTCTAASHLGIDQDALASLSGHLWHASSMFLGVGFIRVCDVTNKEITHCKSAVFVGVKLP